jgi:N-acetylglutamate synthase-like GNAT family acetyltransferase
MAPTIRAATSADQASIREKVLGARLNPRGLDWPNFMVAEEHGRLIGVAQTRKHPDGARELASLVVAPEARGKGVAGGLIEALLAGENGPVCMVLDRPFAGHYRRWGFEQIAPRSAPASVRTNYRIGRVVTGLASLFARRKIRLVVLRRP